MQSIDSLINYLEDGGARVELHHGLPVHGAWVDGVPPPHIEPRKRHQRCRKRLQGRMPGGHRHGGSGGGGSLSGLAETAAHLSS